MDWIYSFFTSAPVVACGTEVSQSVETAASPVVVPALESDSDLPVLIPANEHDKLLAEYVFPDPDEFSAEPDSKYQTKLGAENEHQKRMNKRARNKARRSRGKISWND